MTKYYRIVFEEYDNKPKLSDQKNILLEGLADAPDNRLNFGISHQQQIELITKAQDKVLKLQADQLMFENIRCPKCAKGNLQRFGFKESWFYDVFSDHRVKFPRRRCNKCHHMESETVHSLLGQSLSGELMKIQAELGAQYSYRESQDIMNLFAHHQRRINNHEKIHATSEQVGGCISKLHEIEDDVLSTDFADELIVHVDGGHIKSTEENENTFEAMTAVVYRPEAVKSNKKGTENYITNKSCAASAMSDCQEQMKKRTIIAALKQGLTPKTKITALCDGADNCWNIIDSLTPLSSSVEKVLDWFHLSMKIQNISLPESIKPKLLRIKWHLWRGNCDRAIQRLTELMDLEIGKSIEKIKKLKSYIDKNISKIVNYRERYKKGLPFTSQLGESTVESLINQRCKGQQHMRWSREGLDPILQIRAAMSSQDWNKIWPTVVASI